MMKFQILATAAPANTPCQIIMVAQKGEGKIAKAPGPKDLTTFIQKIIKDGLFTAKVLETLFIPHAPVPNSRHILLVGLGPREKIDHEGLRQAASKAVRALESHQQTTAALDFQSLLPGMPPQKAAQALSEGMILAQYKFKECKKPDANQTSVKELTLFHVKDRELVKKALKEGTILADSVNFARWLADHPSNLMTPSILAREVQKRCHAIPGLKLTVWNKARIIKEKMGGVLGVSAGSHQEPRVLIMEYKGKKTKTPQKPLCFVGKGLTFDAGGISLKPAKNMDEMKFDMCGSVAVIGALLAAARLQLNAYVLGLVGASENMPGGGAVKPSDILTARNGKTMEVLNTDAEGRLVLADILSYACEQKPEFIVDAATLTGAIVVALGNIYSGLFSRHPGLQDQILKAGRQSGEKIWPMPLDDFHVKDIKSVVGDVANIGDSSGAGSSTAAAFLEHFVDKSIPWAHLDIAGTAWNVNNRLPHCRPKSASGVMVRTFIELIRQYIR